MKFKMIHENYNVFDLEKTITFYKKALGLKEKRRFIAEDKSYIIVYMGNDTTDFELELTWNRDRDKPYDLGECEFHLAFQVDDFEESYNLHKKMNCICYENLAMGVYFITDPNGYWLEIVPTK